MAGRRQRQNFPTGRSRTYHVGGPGLKQVEEFNDGLACHVISCSCVTYHKQWENTINYCEHVERIIQERQDKLDLFTDMAVYVPIYSKPALAPIVHLIGTNDPDIIKAELRWSPAMARATTPETSVHLGFVLPSQGRLDLRELILDWLVENSADLPRCTALQHYANYPWGMIALPGHPTLEPGTHFEQFDPSRRDHMACLFDLLVTERCRMCNLDDGVPDLSEVS